MLGAASFIGFIPVNDLTAARVFYEGTLGMTVVQDAPFALAHHVRRLNPGRKGQMMPRVSTYLNFPGTTEEAFTFYSTVFGTEITGPISRMGDMPAQPGAPALTEAEKQAVMHVELPILAGHVLMATDMLESQGQQRRLGNNVTINLELEDRAETERLFKLLSEGGTDLFGLMDMPWGAYWGTCQDRYGTRWMFNCTA